MISRRILLQRFAVLSICTAFCEALYSCNSYTCPDGYIDNVDSSHLLCRDAANCTRECCHKHGDTCVGYVCTPGLVPVASVDPIACKPSGCRDEDCCAVEVTCDTYTCSEGSFDKEDKASIPCGASPSDCDNRKCCAADYHCDAFRCQEPETQWKPQYDEIPCGNTSASCTPEMCCDLPTTCASYTCPESADRANKVSILCGGARECTAAKCCIPVFYCDSFACPSGWRTKDEDNILCGTSDNNCTANTCCDRVASCGSHTCSAGLELRASSNTLLCGDPSSASQPGCSDAICCVSMSSCSMFQCPAGFQARYVKTTIFCSGVCQRDTCCAAQDTPSPETAAAASNSGFLYFFAVLFALLFIALVGAAINALRRRRGRMTELQSEKQPDEGDKGDDNETAILVANSPLVLPTASSVAPPSSVSDVSDNEAQSKENTPRAGSLTHSNPATPTSTLQTAQRVRTIPRLYGVPSHSTLSKGRRRSNTASLYNPCPSAPLSRTPTLGSNTPHPLIPRTNTPRTNTPRTSTPRSVPTKSPPRRRDSFSVTSPPTLVSTASESALRAALSARRRGPGFPYPTQV